MPVCGGGGDPDLCLGEGLEEGGNLEWARWTQLSVGPLPQLYAWGGPPPCIIIPTAGLHSWGGWPFHE